MQMGHHSISVLDCIFF